jgi:hypothetical protein
MSELDLSRPLTPREQLFVKAVCEGKNQTEAVYLAGYKQTMTPENAKKVGSQVASRPHVKAAIAEKLEKRGISPQWVDSKILQVGNDKYAKDSDILKAAELGGKRLKLFDQPATTIIDQREQHVHIDVSDWSEEELTRFLATGKAPERIQVKAS